MRILISPAKQMIPDPDTLAPVSQPRFLPEARLLLETLRQKSDRELQSLWKTNDALTAENIQRVRTMDLTRNLTPALFCYHGIQYQYLGPSALEDAPLAWLSEHLRIGSGFYGLLRPLDGIVPYRLEMQAKLQNPRGKDLYAFWGDQLSRVLAGQTDVIVDLASEEYSKAVSRHWAGQWISPVFAERENGRLREKGVYVKMARGEMVRFLAENQVEDPRQMREFCEMGYRFQPSLSTEHIYFFVRDRATRQKSDF